MYISQNTAYYGGALYINADYDEIDLEYSPGNETIKIKQTDPPTAIPTYNPSQQPALQPTDPTQHPSVDPTKALFDNK